MRQELAVKEQSIPPMTLTNPLDNQENAKKGTVTEPMRTDDSKPTEVDNKVRHEAETNTTPHKGRHRLVIGQYCSCMMLRLERQTDRN